MQICATVALRGFGEIMAMRRKPIHTGVCCVAALLGLPGCGGGGAATAAPAAAAPVPSPDPTPAPATTPVAATCVAGTWRAVAADPGDRANASMPLRYETAHVAFHWTGDLVSQADAEAAGSHLEYVWQQFIGRIGFPEPDCGSATKRKVNVFIGADYGLTGGADGLGQLGMWIGPGGIRDRFGLAHEMTHAFQVGSGGLQDSPFSGWLFESHANWMTHQLPEFRGDTHCSVLSVNYPHLYFGSTRVRYCNWQFLEFVKDRYGYQAINDIWARAPRKGDPAAATADPVEVLMHNRGWTLAQLNDAFGAWALHNANWDYTNPDGSDQGAVYRSKYGGYAPQDGDRLLRSTMLEPVDLARRRFAVPAAWAPQRWGYNIVRLHPDAGAGSVAVSFRGIVQTASATASLPGLADEPATIPAPSSGWRWGLVAVGADGRSRYSALGRDARSEATIALQPGDTALYMIVVAAPDTFQHIRWDQPYYAIYRYPWMAQFSGAMPERYQPGAPPPVAGGRRHANGGGWVAEGATVEAGAYVGPYARVLSGTMRGAARLEDHAVLDGGQLLGNARAGALSVIRGDTIVRDDARVATTFLGIGEYERGIVLSGTAQNIGDVEQRGASAARGVFYGFVDPGVVTDPKRGAALDAPVPEVTAPPVYRWQD
jgi:hypothetical protein